MLVFVFCCGGVLFFVVVVCGVVGDVGFCGVLGVVPVRRSRGVGVVFGLGVGVGVCLTPLLGCGVPPFCCPPVWPAVALGGLWVGCGHGGLGEGVV